MKILVKKKTTLTFLFLTLLCFLVSPSTSFCQECNVSPVNKWAWGENIGWLNFLTGQSCATITDDYLYGYVWGENVGWISLGDGPEDGSQYCNCSATDFGVNNDGGGNLSGYAWGENIGWISFSCENTGSCETVDYGVSIDENGDFQGYAWGENAGWISFSSPFHQLSMSRCGDGIVQSEEGEECEIGVGDECGPYEDCVDCLCIDGVPGLSCGDGVIQWKQGETCDPPGSICGSRGSPSWVCDDFCQCLRVEPYCGDGIVQWKAGEECEPGVGNECGSGRYCEPTSCRCVEDPGPVQACCDPEAICLDLTLSECRAEGGIPQGLGTDCGDVICHLPPEACCSPSGFCIDMALDICLDFSGVPLGVGTNCDVVTCP